MKDYIIFLLLRRIPQENRYHYIRYRFPTINKRYGFNNRKYTTNTHTDMITKDTFLVSFNIQGEGFCEPFLVTYRTEELNPYLRYPRQTLNPNHLHVHFTKQVIRELMKMPYYDIEILDFIRVPS